MITSRPFVCCCLYVIFLAPSTAFAYIDPGTGSLVLQILIAGLVSVIVTLKLYFRHITNFLLGKKTDSKSQNAEEKEK